MQLCSFCNAACLLLFLHFTPRKTRTDRKSPHSAAPISKNPREIDACEALSLHNPDAHTTWSWKETRLTMKQKSTGHFATQVLQLKTRRGGACSVHASVGEGHPSLLSPQILWRDSHCLTPHWPQVMHSLFLKGEPAIEFVSGSTLWDSESECNCLRL